MAVFILLPGYSPASHTAFSRFPLVSLDLEQLPVFLCHEPGIFEADKPVTLQNALKSGFVFSFSHNRISLVHLSQNPQKLRVVLSTSPQEAHGDGLSHY